MDNEEAVDNEEAFVAVLDPRDVVCSSELEEVVAIVVAVVGVICVCATNTDGVKIQEVAEDEAELRDEYVSLRTEELILKTIDGIVLQQILI